MFRLFEAGKSPAEIARACEEGTAGCSPFSIPRRTAHDIVTKMAEEAERRLPASIVEVEAAEDVERFPVRIARILDAEIERLSDKQRKGGLSAGDYDRLARATDLSFALQKRLEQRQRPVRRGSHHASKDARSQPAPESALAKLAREQAGRKGDGEHLNDAHSCLTAAEPDQAEPVARDQAPPSELGRRRAEARVQARAALATAG